jgi:hypothetical protein
MNFMAVQAVVPLSLQNKYRVDGPETIPNVTVIGPPDKIALLKAEDPNVARPYAKVEITSEDVSGTVRTRRLKFETHDISIRVAPEDLQREVNIKLVERATEQ